MSLESTQPIHSRDQARFQDRRYTEEYSRATTQKKGVRGLFFKMMAGTLGGILAVSALWFGVGSYFLAQLDQTGAQLDQTGAQLEQASQIEVQMLQARSSEKDFFQRGVTDPTWYEQGTGRYR